MVKSKRELTTPRRRNSLSKQRILDRTISKVVSRPNSGTSTSRTPAVANIKVVVRVRPPNGSEREENCRIVVKVVDDQMLIFDPKEDTQGFFFHGVQQKGRDLLKKSHKDMKFIFDKVFPENVTTEEVFKDSTYTLIDSLMDGFNCSVFAYGATGAGKTFTMTGKADCPGITYLTMTELFRKQSELSVERDFELGITYLEVYNELVKDLLNPGVPLNLREDAKYGVTVAGIKLYQIKSPDELFNLLEQGNKNRTQHPTDANAESSRSHAVFQVYIKMTIKGTKELRTAKLSMIDLAGSERGSATGFAGARFTEGANINKSLLALGNCINSLADGHRHVPYRDSKLTRLLKDSLGGNCQTVMIANVSPSSLTFEDTYNTLKYATRAKKIKSNMKRNIVNVEAHVGQYIKMIEDLKQENSALKKELEDSKKRECDNSDVKEMEGLREEINELKIQLKEEMSKKSESNLQKECERLRIQCDLLSRQLNSNTDQPEGGESEGNNNLMKRLESIRHNGHSVKKERTFVKDLLDNIGDDGGGADELILNEIKALIEEKREYLERQFQLEKTESGTYLQRCLKEETDARLSDICVNTPEKQDARKKINMAIDRLKKKETALKGDLDQVEDCISNLEQKIEKMKNKYPEIERFLKEEVLKLSALRLKHKLQIQEKSNELLHKDQEEKTMLLEKMGSTLKSWYMLLQGHGFASSDIVQHYHEIVMSFQGRKNIKWKEAVDSGTSSMASIPEADKEVRAVGNKRKIEENPPENLDDTFTLPVVFSPRPRKTEQVMSKVLKPPPTKRLANYPTRSPRNKENKTYRRPFDTTKSVAAAKAIVAAKTNSGLRGTAKTPTKPLSLADRPRFRS
ncbi:uncharacterized protein [Leptinotarsa decemlineata]|uniref:uncharacterized protein n=1 Tax=Leptinotarsa decemlineata TaxID=7539 RepID=UPI003D3044C5